MKKFLKVIGISVGLLLISGVMLLIGTTLAHANDIYKRGRIHTRMIFGNSAAMPYSVSGENGTCLSSVGTVWVGHKSTAPIGKFMKEACNPGHPTCGFTIHMGADCLTGPVFTAAMNRDWGLVSRKNVDIRYYALDTYNGANGTVTIILYTSHYGLGNKK